MVPYHKYNKKEMHWLYMYADVFWDPEKKEFLKRSLASLARAYNYM